MQDLHRLLKTTEDENFSTLKNNHWHQKVSEMNLCPHINTPKLDI